MGASSSSSAAKVPPNSSDARPVPPEYRNPAVYNVYGERLNDPNAVSTKNPLLALKSTQIIDPR